VRTLVLLTLALFACGGIGERATSPQDAGADVGTMDAERGADASPGPDAWWTADLGQGQCGAGWTQRLYAPNEFVWCEAMPGMNPNPGVSPCGALIVVGWYRAGLVKCQSVAVDGGID
jgi:hypothetical protein